jgi:hypothetical protein
VNTEHQPNYDWRLVRVSHPVDTQAPPGGHGSWVETNHPAVVACMGSVPECAANGCQARIIRAALSADVPHPPTGEEKKAPSKHRWPGAVAGEYEEGVDDWTDGMEGWQPIASAPTDGTPVRLRRVFNGAVIAEGRGYFGDVTIYYAGGPCVTFAGQDYIEPSEHAYRGMWVNEDGRHLFPTPTHWMPIPPASAEVGSQPPGEVIHGPLLCDCERPPQEDRARLLELARHAEHSGSSNMTAEVAALILTLLTASAEGSIPSPTTKEKA